MIMSDIKIARWSERFLAWLIDFVIITIIIGIITSVIITEDIITNDYDIWENAPSYIITSLVFFAYWVIIEYKTNQSIGKKVFRLKIVDKDGAKPDIKKVAISSFGKSFLLPIDVIGGWIFTNKNRQRLFNKISDTIVVKINSGADIIYEKD